MSKLRPVIKKEESRSPSPALTVKADFSLQPPPPHLDDMTDLVKKEEPLKKEERLSLSLTSFVTIKMESKIEPEASVSPSPSLSNGPMSSHKTKLSPTPTPAPQSRTTSGATSTVSTPSDRPPTANSKKAQASVVQLISHLPVARGDALATFTEIIDNNYQYKTLGRSREALESMTCDCVYEHGIDEDDDACGPGSDCINRLTQVECLPDDCRCKTYCQNQRFQKREYAHIEIILTEKKGYGLRAENNLPKDTFIYEYVGDVVNPISFKKRMRDYASEGIQHFYFMMLQKDEFIDATKSGGIGRFANHSCKPNCYVAKWTVGHHVRMGIFAKRDIKKHEELTFNYNVDRYGHQAQTCYCGEPNCVGYIGGKTQTDIASMDDLYLDALGITDEADLLELKGSKKKKGKKIDDPDFMPAMKPIVEKDVPKVVQAIRQTQSRKVLLKLLTRVKITEDQAALRQIMRLRGYSVMTNVLEDYASDLELIALVLECIKAWPLINRNKVEDSKVGVPVHAITEKDNFPQSLRDLAQSLLVHWQSLPLYNRIAKRVKKDGEEEGDIVSTLDGEDESTRQAKRSKLYVASEHDSTRLNLAPPDTTTPWAPSKEVVDPLPQRMEFSRESIKAIIAAAAEAKVVAEQEAAEAAMMAEAAAAAKAAEAAAKAEAREERKKLKAAKKAQTEEEKAANKEKRLLKLVGAVVVKCMSKYSKSMDHDMFKKHAKELTQLIADKEKRSSSYKDAQLDKLSDEKVAKIKKFAKEYIAKILRKLEKTGHHHSRAPSSSTRQTTDTPNSVEGVDVVMAEMTVEEDMDRDMDPDSERSEDEEEERGGSGVQSPASPFLHSSPPEAMTLAEHAQKLMDPDEEEDIRIQLPSDPRRRPPNDNIGWESHEWVDGLSATSRQ